MTKDIIRQYLPEEVSDHLFTQSRLSRMGLAPTANHVAYVFYPEQKREFKLYDVHETKQRKQQKGFSLIQKNATVEQILAERKHEIEVRKSLLGSR